MSNGKRILVVEDEPDIAGLIEFHLQRERFETRLAPSGGQAIAMVDAEPIDLLLLDIMLPDTDGLEVCRRLKSGSETSRIPIIFVSARGEESDVVAGLELGADDYVTKPFSPSVLLARVRAVLRRHGTVVDTSTLLTAVDGRIVIDQSRHRVRVDNKDVELTLTQYKILECLARRPGFVRTRSQIVSAMHGDHAVLSSRSVDVHVAALRRKLGKCGDTIETVRGVGYRLTEDHPVAPAG